MRSLRLILGGVLLTLVALVVMLPIERSGSTVANRAPGAPVGSGQESSQDGEVVISQLEGPYLTIPLKDAAPPSDELILNREINPRLSLDHIGDPDLRLPGGPDPLLPLQANGPSPTDPIFLTPEPASGYAGLGFTSVSPPDTVGDVGPDHYVQMVNHPSGSTVRVMEKDGTILGTFMLDSLGSGNCADGRGDPIVLYDQLADRWLLAEFTQSSNDMCIYISQTENPLGTYLGYSFTAPSFPDYPKFGIWPDAYVMTSNEGSTTRPVYALERRDMLQGLTASVVRFTVARLTGFGFQTLTPADLDGATAPPANAQPIVMRHRDTEAHGPAGNPSQDFLELWSLSLDWDSATFSINSLPSIALAEFDSELCGFFSFSCVPQPGDPEDVDPLDPLREVVMWRLQYRNFGSHQSLVGNLVTDASGSDHHGIRWFELRNTGAGWTLHQEGTFAPDALHRWMGSIAMDAHGNIALGYSVSSSSLNPGIRYAGRLASDPLGTLPQNEGMIFAGASPQFGSERWGDYAAMSVDPADDCTFWFTTEYGTGNVWATRIATMRFNSCGQTDPEAAIFPTAITRTQLANVSINHALTISNTGDASLGWAIFDEASLGDQPIRANCDFPDDMPWLSLSSSSGQVAIDDIVPLTVTFDSVGLSPGTNTGTLCLTTDDQDNPLIEVPVSMSVVNCGAPNPPANVTGDVNGSDEAVLSWTHTGDSAYALHWNGTQPYFKLGDPGTQDEAVSGPFAGTVTHTHTGALSGGQAEYYLVANSCGPVNGVTLSERTGRIGYPILPGD